MKSRLSQGVLLISAVSMACAGEGPGLAGPSTSNGPISDGTRRVDLGRGATRQGSIITAAKVDFDINNPAPTRVTHGSVIGTVDGTQFDTRGSRGFRFSGFSASSPTILNQEPIVPGSTYTLGLLAATPFEGALTYRGTDYAIHGIDSFGVIEFSTAAITIPAEMQPSLHLSMPFTVSGVLGSCCDSTGSGVFIGIEGSGVAETFLRAYPNDPFYDVAEVRYTFTP